MTYPRQLFALVLSCAVSVALAAGCDDPLSPPDDPDGAILFAGGQNDAAEIFAIRPDGSARRQLTTNDAFDGEAVWSPDRRRILFTSTRDSPPDDPQRGQVYIMNHDGSRQRRLTDEPFGAHSPSWSPDGGRILFARPAVARGGREIWVMSSNGSNRRRLVSGGVTNGSPAWSPDGTQILFTSLRDGRQWHAMYLADTNGTNVRGFEVDWCQFNVSSPRWSRDGEWIVFTCESVDATGVHVARIDGRQIDRYTPPFTFEMSGVWASDGERIAVHSTRDGMDDLYVVRLVDRVAVRVTTDALAELPTDWR